MVEVKRPWQHQADLMHRRQSLSRSGLTKVLKALTAVVVARDSQMADTVRGAQEKKLKVCWVGCGANVIEVKRQW